MWWTALIGPVVDLFKTEMKNKAEEKQAVHARKLKSIEIEGSWDDIQASNASGSWKDEWFTVLLSIPLIGAFYPDALPHVIAGFEALDSMPDFYKMFLGAAVGASFGIKALSKWGGKE